MQQKELLRLQFEAAEIQRQQQAMQQECNRLLPAGRVILFKKGNMSKPAQGRVVWAKVWGGSLEIRVTSLTTGKERKIGLSNILPSGKAEH
jgi:hypothetical protein